MNEEYEEYRRIKSKKLDNTVFEWCMVVSGFSFIIYFIYLIIMWLKLGVWVDKELKDVLVYFNLILPETGYVGLDRVVAYLLTIKLLYCGIIIALIFTLLQSNTDLTFEEDKIIEDYQKRLRNLKQNDDSNNM